MLFAQEHRVVVYTNSYKVTSLASAPFHIVIYIQPAGFYGGFCRGSAVVFANGPILICDAFGNKTGIGVSAAGDKAMQQKNLCHVFWRLFYGIKATEAVRLLRSCR